MPRDVWSITGGTLVLAGVAVLGVWLCMPAGRQEIQTVSHTTTTGDAAHDLAWGQQLARLTQEVTTLRQGYDHLTQHLLALEALLPTVSTAEGASGPSTSRRRVYEQLSHRLQALETTLQQVSRASGRDRRTAERPPDQDTDRAVSDTRRGETVAIAATVAELDFRIRQEANDIPWSAQAIQDITTLLEADALEGSHVLGVDCQATLCRIEMVHADVTVQHGLPDRLPREPPFDGEMLLVWQEDNPLSPRTLVYLARQGYPLLGTAP